MIWTPNMDDALRAWSGQGYSASQIAERLATTRNAVCGRRFRLGIQVPGHKPFSDEEVAKLISMRQQRKSAAEIGDALGRSEGSIYVKISKLGIARPYTKQQSYNAMVTALLEIAAFPSGPQSEIARDVLALVGSSQQPVDK